MKALPQLLSSLLVASVAMLNSGAVMSGAQAKKGQVKSSLKSTVKRAPLADGSAKRVLKVVAPAVVAQPQAAAGEGVPVSARAVTTAPHASPVAVVPLALAPTLSLASSAPVIAVKETPAVSPAAPVVAKETPATSPAAPVVVKETPPASPVAPVVAKAAPEPVATATPTVSEAWKQIAKGPAVVTVTTTTAVTAAAPTGNPYLAYRAATYNQAAPSLPPVAPAAPAAPAAQSGTQLVNQLRSFLPEPHLPSPDIDILPSVTKVYPTGERPMYVLTFKCPTELVGITPPPTKALRWLISSGMDAVNSTNLLSFSMQQVCQ